MMMLRLSVWSLFLLLFFHFRPQIALVGGDYSEILETVCGTSVIAVGSTLYELDGVDLDSREFGVASLSTATCTLDDTWGPSAACYG